jgi:nitric oxide reductase large subunit
MQFLRWMRLFGDTVFAIGAIAFVYFAISIMRRERPLVSESEPIAELA